MSYDSYLDKKTDEYMSGCQHYKNDNGIHECCRYCDLPCEDYIETLDKEDIIEQLFEAEDYLDICIKSKNIKLATSEKLKIENKIKLLKNIYKRS